MHCKVYLDHFGQVISYLSESDTDVADRRLSGARWNFIGLPLGTFIHLDSAISSSPIDTNIWKYHYSLPGLQITVNPVIIGIH